MRQRIQKILSARGIASRRKAEEMLAAGQVRVNGATAALGDSADPELDEILVRGEPIPPAAKHVYIILYKPRGYVTTLSDEKGRKNVSELVKDCAARVYPVGRLDMDSEGLLLLTNDGAFANTLMHPRHEVSKIYEVWVSGYTRGSETALKSPIELDGYRIAPPQVSLLHAEGKKAKLLITIHEGRNRQIRRMCERVGMRVDRLKRIQEGSLRLGALAPGSWRYLTPEEITDLLK